MSRYLLPWPFNLWMQQIRGPKSSGLMPSDPALCPAICFNSDLNNYSLKGELGTGGVVIINFVIFFLLFFLEEK